MELSATEPIVTPALQFGELVQEINKDHLTQSGRMLSFALEESKAGNNLWFFTANALSDNYSPVDLHKFQHS